MFTVPFERSTFPGRDAPKTRTLAFRNHCHRRFGRNSSYEFGASMTTSDKMDVAEFPGYVAERLSSVPGVTAVALGGSRAAGTQRPDSDWDFSLYYRGLFEAEDLRALR